MASRWTTRWFTGTNDLLTDKRFGRRSALVESPSPLPISCESAGLFTACEAEACSSSASSMCTRRLSSPTRIGQAFHEGLHFSLRRLTVVDFQEPRVSRKVPSPSVARTYDDFPQHGAAWQERPEAPPAEAKNADGLACSQEKPGKPRGLGSPTFPSLRPPK